MYRGYENQGVAAYFDSLINELQVNSGDLNDYIPLLHQLYAIEFKVKLPKDNDRVAKAMLMRRQFEEISGYDLNNMYGCSVLEVLVGLSVIIAEDILGDEEAPELKLVLFMDFLNNLGLMGCVGDRYDRGDACIRVEIWMNRDFEPDGLGSPFPLNNPPGDMRDAEIWKQAMWYLAEHYDGD